MATARLVPATVFDGTKDEALCLEDAARAVYRIGTLALPAGAYTLSLWMRADAPMGVGLNILGRRARAEATEAWQRFSWWTR